ncbi:MAG: F0F1 ATP synthase subunit A [Planctomycetes bacterium]|nr:F0F1 ATP synthase subunit A [Planctomycetota bacterium]
MNQKPVRFYLAVILAFICLAGLGYSGDIERELPLQIGGLYFNHNTIMMCFIVAVLLCLLTWVCVHILREIPAKGQALFEMVFGAFDDLVTQSIGRESARKYLPWIGSLFLFLWFSNMIGMLPIPHTSIGGEGFNDYNHNGIYDPHEFSAEHDTNGNKVNDPGIYLPAFEEPTADYNVPLALAILFVLFIGHGGNIRKHGLWGYIKRSYFDPPGMMGIIMAPLNVVSKLAELVSISFRLFGNIFGGAVIIIVVSGLLHNLVLPVGLLGFFGVFVGTVQAFVFTMLALTYISLGVAEEE